jgi:glycosyltransferase involved in cell wall biosynthesis
MPSTIQIGQTSTQIVQPHLNQGINKPMFCSIIIPTVGRPSLSKSIESVLQQNFADAEYEIIVVNDSGQPFPAATWQTSPKVRIITTQKRERCFARNTGAAIAKGSFFCFLDDDDWLLPNALTHLWQCVQTNPEAKWVYGGVVFVAGEQVLGILNQNKSGNCFVEAMTETWIPIQASLIEADVFFEVGGFDPDFVVTQDLDLLRRIALSYDLAYTPEPVAAIERSDERKTKTKYSMGWYYIAKGRNSLLSDKNALSRLLKSADNSAYLHGLVIRNYKNATMFNLRQHHWLAALNRFILGMTGTLKSLAYLFSKDFWLAVKDNRPLHLSLIENPSSDYASVEEWLF